MSLDQEAWAEIARLWLDGAEPLGRIAERFSISHQKITAYARREQWPPRRSNAQKDGPDNRIKESGGGRGAATGDGGAGRREHRGAGRGKNATAREPATVAPSRRWARNRAGARRAMVERLFDAMDTKLSAIEERIAAGGDVTPADSERTTRALNTLVRSLEKLSDYEGKISKKAGRDDGKMRQASDDPERRRQELARRIERLLKRR
ncbi:MAG: hypothetical protein AB7U75_13155 [Hyphomicrobiaceae bacterium]